MVSGTDSFRDGEALSETQRDSVTLDDVVALLAELALERPVFHSEADFQHALAWQLQRRRPDARIRLETRPLDGQSIYLDLFAVMDDVRVAFELKYLVRALDVTIAGERFDLRNQGAHDVRRYDVVKDISRLERLVAAGAADVGFAIALANDPGYWTPGTKADSFDADFRVFEGARLTGTRDWSSEASAGTTRGRTNPIELIAEHVVGWRDYSRVLSGTAGAFRYVALEITSSALQPFAKAELSKVLADGNYENAVADLTDPEIADQ